MKFYDQHVHTNFSFDSSVAIEEYLEYCDASKKEYFVCTDHIDFNPVFQEGDIIIDYNEVRKYIDSIRNRYNTKILIGVEMGYRKEYLKEINNLLKKYTFDVVLMSIHDHEIGMDYMVKKDHKKMGQNEMLTFYFENILDGVKSMDNFDILTHMDYAFRGAYEEVSFYDFEEIVKEIMIELIRKGKVLEINTASIRKLGTTKYVEELVKLFVECGGTEFSIGSDSHRFCDYEANFGEVVAILLSYGIDYVICFQNREKRKMTLK